MTEQGANIEQLDMSGLDIIERVLVILICRLAKREWFPEEEQAALQAFVNRVNGKPTKIWGA